ncbi:MAG: serine hydrolase domain-containing protein [Pseudomonadota bacterium]|jgi:CubicO group peptidase (beta-lactamase class C family)|nr:lipolytic protein [uncultured bacterium]
MRRHIAILALSIAAASVLPPRAAARDLPTLAPARAGLSQAGIARLDAAMERHVREGRIPGAVVLVARNGAIVHHRSYGVSDRPSARPMRNDDIFRIYSMTKPVVSVALLMLYEEGHFQLSDPLERYIPEFRGLMVHAGVDANGAPRLETPRRKPTIQDAMRHTLGIGAGGGPEPVARLYRENRIWVNTMESLAQQMELLGKVPLLYHPGEQWLYGYGHDVQARLVEIFSGLPIDQFLAQRIFGPLGMKDTGYGVPPEKRHRVATLHDVPEEMPANPAVDMRPSTYERFAGHPFGTLGLWSTAMDYARFAQMLANGGELDGVRILGSKTVQLMSTNHLPPHITQGGQPGTMAPGEGYGLGVSVTLDPAAAANLGSTGAFGWSGAATTWFTVDPEEKLVAVLMAQKHPYDERLLKEFQTLVYQAIAD